MKLHCALALNSIFLVTVACHPASQNERRGRDHKLLLISFDGFRWDYDQDVETPNMDNLVKEGVRAKYITPPFVTMTSPSHFTTISGRWIEDHGVIHNMMFNTETLRKYGHKETQNKSEWWDNGVLPLWITAQNQWFVTKVQVHPTFFSAAEFSGGKIVDHKQGSSGGVGCGIISTQLYLSFSTNPDEAVAVLNRCLAEVMGWMRANKLKLNPDKTEVLLVGELGFGEGELNLVLNGVALPLRDKVRSLGVLLEPELSLEAQVTAVARSAFLQLWLILQLHPYLEYDCLATVTHALVTSRLDFCNVLYVGLPSKTVRILQLMQNRASRLLMGTGRYVHMTPVLRQLHWLPIEVWVQFKVLVMTYKALNGLGPGYLKERLRPYMPAHPLRSAGEALLWKPSVKEIRSTSTRRRAFSAVAPNLWNALPREVRLVPSLYVFRCKGKRVASFHYPGGGANYSGQAVKRTLVESFTHPDSNETEWRENIDIVLGWFAKEDFDFVTLYYGEPDNVGHRYGPETEARRKMVQQIDRTFGYLVEAIEKHGLKDTLNVIITSDHGMTTVKKSPAVEEILLAKYIKFKDVVKFDILDYGGFGMILPKPGKEEEIYQALKNVHPHLKVYKKQEFPEHFHYAKHKRILPLLLYGDSGYSVNGRFILYVNKGDHGFDNQGMDMKTIFIAFGPAFKKGYTAEPFDSIHIYPLMCELLGVQPEPHNGSLAFTRDMLVPTKSFLIPFIVICIMGALLVLLPIVAVACRLSHRKKR
ncbi:Ectonucleotide pyrophosphatase/phosphodiesterase family member 7 [Varanus komodoensis]|nr:Ectonucleotide pyrophosphatase/phosphodiesterase family member 7 [Varanus komodoensis]